MVVFSVVVELPVSGAVLLVVVVVLESVEFCVTSGEGAGAAGDASATGEAGASVVVVVVSLVVSLHPTTIEPAMKASAAMAANEAMFFTIFMRPAYQDRISRLRRIDLVGSLDNQMKFTNYPHRLRNPE
ncbi:MAG: hypothetical protein HY269_04835 [Deltaproteobacteria bacterium]|nr:hypothetical protein [Deltaproteobacteria bacterium]